MIHIYIYESREFIIIGSIESAFLIMSNSVPWANKEINLVAS